MNIHRWKTGKKPLGSLWTEYVGHVMRADETPEDVARKFVHWLETGEWD